MFQASLGLVCFASLEESSSAVPVLSCGLGPICIANRINVALKTQLASATTTLRLPDRPLFSKRLSIQNSAVSCVTKATQVLYRPRINIFSRKRCFRIDFFVCHWAYLSQIGNYPTVQENCNTFGSIPFFKGEEK